MNSKKVAVFCGASEGLDPEDLEMTREVGKLLGTLGFGVVYGGASVGLMGALADSAIQHGSEVYGVIPKYFDSFEMTHNQLHRLDFVSDLAERKKRMLEESDAVLVLPGGSGTLDEFYETLMAKRFGAFKGPIWILERDGFYQSLQELFENQYRRGYIKEEERTLWSLIESIRDLEVVLRELI